MGKHNGKARSGGIKVGKALMNSKAAGGGGGRSVSNAGRHTTESGDGRRNMQSVVEQNDIQELLHMAELTDRDFIAERQNVVVIPAGATAVGVLEEERARGQRVALQEQHADKLRIPRRPAWAHDTTVEQLDENERASFLEWRRALAWLEQDENLFLTPFEKNLDVWRQLWRVLERSDIIVQVVDARDPLLYRSADLESYARELHASKSSLILLNKADLLPAFLRAAWADYFDAHLPQLDYCFWSAKTAEEELATSADAPAAGGCVPEGEDDDARIRVLSGPELLARMEACAERAVAARRSSGGAPGEPLVAGLVGYPNVGKSSTINALFGAKKTAVAPTPGKTKHFQTLHASPRLVLCDCPGLVLPKFANSKAEMVAAGVIPIDRLTDTRTPVEVVARNVPRNVFAEVLHLHLPTPAAHEDPSRPPSAAELLRAMASARGWVVGGGLPDEARAGRHLLKSYVSGQLLHCEAPPAWTPSAHLLPQLALVNPAAARGFGWRPSPATVADSAGPPADSLPVPSHPSDARDGAEASPLTDPLAVAIEPDRCLQAAKPAAPSGASDAADLSLADLDLLEGLGLDSGKPRQKRAEHKFQKKLTRSKGDRGRKYKQDDASGYDGAALVTGKRGGIVRVTSAS